MTSLTLTNLEVKKNPAYTRWVCQVNANYHGGMSEADAVEMAGPEPKKWLLPNGELVNDLDFVTLDGVHLETIDTAKPEAFIGELAHRFGVDASEIVWEASYATA